MVRGEVPVREQEKGVWAGTDQEQDRAGIVCVQIAEQKWPISRANRVSMRFVPNADHR